MSYARYRQMFTVQLAAGRTLNQILWTLPLAGNRIITIFNFYVYITTAGSAGAQITLLVDGSALSPTLRSTYATGTGLIGRDSAGSTTMPAAFTTAAAGSRLEASQTVADTTGIGTLVIDLDFQR